MGVLYILLYSPLYSSATTGHSHAGAWERGEGAAHTAVDHVVPRRVAQGDQGRTGASHGAQHSRGLINVGVLYVGL